MRRIIKMALINFVYMHSLYAMNTLNNSLRQLEGLLINLEQTLQKPRELPSFQQPRDIFKTKTLTPKEIRRTFFEDPRLRQIPPAIPQRAPQQPLPPSRSGLQPNLVSTAGIGETITRKNFVDDLLGMSEENFRINYGWSNQGVYKPEANGHLTNAAFIIDGQSLSGALPPDIVAWIKEYPRRAALFQGDFEYYTNEEVLQKITQSRGGNKFVWQPRFTFRIHDPEFIEPTDIRYLQAYPSNKYASFQIASTFFGPLEGGMIKFDNPLGVTSFNDGMFHGAAQGEEASIAAGGATIYRKYIMPTQRIALGNKFGYYYLLDNIRSRDGKLKLPWGVYGHAADINNSAAQNYYPPTIRKDPQAFRDDIAHVGIGNHKYVVVSSGGGTFQGVKPSKNDIQEKLNIVVDLNTGKVDLNNTQIVNQIFSAAYSLRTSRGAKIDQPKKTLARMALQASYIGNVRAAYLNALESGNNTLFLTLMGAGAFENSIEWIGEAMEQIKNEMKRYNLQIFLLYRNDSHKKHRKADTDKDFILKMIAIMDEINGTRLSSNQQLLGYINGYIDAAFIHKNKQHEAQYADAINRALDSDYPRKPVIIGQGQNEGRAATPLQPVAYQSNPPTISDEGWVVTTPPLKRGSWRRSRGGN